MNFKNLDRAAFKWIIWIWTNEYLLVYVYEFPYSSTKVNSKSTLVFDCKAHELHNSNCC